LARNGSGVYSLPAIYEATTGDTILATQHNTPLEDLEQDMNTVRPIVAGGTEASTEIAALDNLHIKGTNIASAGTTNLATATGDYVHVTGTTTITALGTADAGNFRTVVFDGALTLTHNGTSLILPSAANITTAAGDVAVFRSEGSGNWKCVGYHRATGRAIIGATPASTTDNTVPRFDGTAGALQTSGVTISDTDVVGAYGLTLTSTDAGAGADPVILMDRNSATPAANDVLGVITGRGRDSGGNATDYAKIEFSAKVVTGGSEEGRLRYYVTRNGSDQEVTSYTIDAQTYTTSAAGQFLLNTNSDANVIRIMGGNATTSALLDMYGASHATLANDYRFRSNSADVYYYDFSATQHQFTGGTYTSGVARVGQNTTNGPGNGNNTAGIALDGATGNSFFSGASSMFVNRTSDGTIISLNASGTTQGLINISGATASYGTFFGVHWSQLEDGSKPDILRGTIVESIDEMCTWKAIEWTDDDGVTHIDEANCDQGSELGEIYISDGDKIMPARVVEIQNDTLPRFKISDEAESPSVYGVFHVWDGDDALIGSLGAYVIRIRPGEIVRRGDLIESAGNGCGRVQPGDIFCASTVAKVTSSKVVEVYPDGSYLVPCTLHCG
jgi:hypothetical protein